jgi:hypothetical protein
MGPQIGNSARIGCHPCPNGQLYLLQPHMSGIFIGWWLSGFKLYRSMPSEDLT